MNKDKEIHRLRFDMERTCKKCGETKSIEEFVKNKNCKNGITYECLQCKNNKQLKFRINNREYVNMQARNYGDKRHPYRIEQRKLIDAGFKKCSKCGNIFEFKEFHKGRAICYKCRTGHERGIFINKTDDGRFLKRLSEEEKKINRRENVKRWGKANPEKRKAIEKRCRNKPEYKIRVREYAKNRYHTKGLTINEIISRKRYANSNRGIEIRKKARETWVKHNPEKLKIKDKRQRDNLNDCYVINKIKRQVIIDTKLLRKYPELIEIKRLQIKLKRLANEKRN